MRQPGDWDNLIQSGMYPDNIQRDIAMTQHLLQEQTQEDQRIMHRLAIVVGGFVAFTALLAITVGVIMG